MLEKPIINSSSKFQSWDITSFFKHSVGLARRNPKLLLLAIAFLVLSAGSMGSYNTNFPNLNQDQKSSNQEIEVNQNVSIPFNVLFNEEDLKENDSDKLTSINNLPDNLTEKNILFAENLEDIIETASKKIPTWVYIFFGVQILILSLFVIGLSLATTAWAQAAMIQGVRQAEEVDNNQWSLSQVSKFAISKIKPMIWMNIVPMIKIFLLTVGITIIFPVSVGLAALLFNTNTQLISIFIIIIAFIFALTFAIIMISKIIKIIFVRTVGQRLVVFKTIKANEAYQESKKIVQNKYGKMILLSLSHFIILDIILTSLSAIPIIAVLGTFISSNFQTYLNSTKDQLFSTVLNSFSVGWVSAILLASLITIIASSCVKVIAVVVKNANWHWATLTLLSKVDNFASKVNNQTQIQ
jgi:hypothetical protein